MATEMLQYLDPDGLDETVLNIGQIKTILEGQISDLGESIEEEMQDLPYARPDGFYPDMTVGAVQGAPQTSQWAERESAGSGTAIVRSVQGATVVWNQLVVNGNFANGSQYWTARMSTLTVVDGVATVTPTSDGTARGLQASSTMGTAVAGHKYLISTEFNTNEATNLSVSFAGVSPVIIEVPSTGVWYKCRAIWTNSDETRILPYLLSAANVTTSAQFKYRNVQIFDLTQMFGAGNEPTTVEEFERMYPEAYYPYSEPTLKPVRIAGIASTDANDDALDSVEWETQTLWGAGEIGDLLYSDHKETRVGVVDLGTLNWATYNTSVQGSYRLRAQLPTVIDIPSSAQLGNLTCVMYQTLTGSQVYTTHTGIALSSGQELAVYDPNYNQQDSAAAFKAAMQGVMCAYELATPTTTPISPALPMSYRVQQGGTESIVVPDGEMSAAPVLTIKDPLNVAAEFARVWEAIGQLQSRGTAQLSRPVSLADDGTVDETQKDTTDVADIETTKEVQE